MHGVRTYWNHLLGLQGCALIWAPFSWFSFVFNEKGGAHLLEPPFQRLGCDTYSATAHPKGPVHLLGGLSK